MIRIIAALVLIAVGPGQHLYAQTVITQWNFNGASIAEIPGGVNAPLPSTGTGTLQLVGGVTAIFDPGLGSTDPLGNPPNFTLRTKDYPALGANDKTAGIEFTLSTVGFNTISLVFDQRLSNTSPNSWVVLYTADISAGSPVWQEFKLFTFVPDASTTGDRWYNQRAVDFSTVTSLNDNPNAAFRIVATFDVSGNYLAAKSTSTYATTGNSRFDMVTVSGIPNVIIQNDPPTASAVKEAGIFAVGDTLHAAYSYADAEGDDEGASIYQWYSASDADGTNSVQIAGADTLIYVITANDVTKFISFEVTPVAQTGGSPGTAVKTAFAGPVLDLGDPSVVKINEVYTRGLDTNPNPDLHADWVEFYNPGPKDVTLAGLRICDSGSCELFVDAAYAQLIVPAGGYLTLDEDQVNSFTFGLSSLGEFVALRHFDSSLIDSMVFPALADTQSFGRYPDGTANVFKLVPPTKATTNTTATLTFGDQTLLKINEVYSRGDASHSDSDLKFDWVEFYNPGSEDVTLTGLSLCNSATCVILTNGSPLSFMVPAGGFFTVSHTGTSVFSVHLSEAGEQVTLRLYAATIDSLVFPAMGENQTYGRLEDGTVFTTLLEPPTRNMSNNTATAIEVTGIEYESLQMRLFPNPASSTLTVEVGGKEVIEHISLFNVTGQEVISQPSGRSSVQVPVSGLSRGFYLVRTTFGSGKLVMRRLFKD